MKTAIERFEEKFTKSETGCWLWAAGQFDTGYGAFKMDGVLRYAHRVAYEFYIGKIQDGLFVCHACDVKPCVRPDHLWLGTPADNMLDMAEKGRSAKGVTHGSRTHPERLARGAQNGAHTHPENRARGDRHGSRLHPERCPRGEQNGSAKITTEGVLAIRAAVGMTQKQLALKHNMSRSQISSIRSGKNWAHLIPEHLRSIEPAQTMMVGGIPTPMAPAPPGPYRYKRTTELPEVRWAALPVEPANTGEEGK